MSKITLLCCALALTSGTAVAASSAFRYNSAGIPDFSGFVVGSSTLTDVEASLGQPMNLATNELGQPDVASFYVPMQGDSSVRDTPATSAIKATLFSSIRNHAGALVSRVPGVGGIIGATALDQAPANTIATPSKVWACDIYFIHAYFSKVACLTISRPLTW